jgi:hypothetical protein
MATAYRMTHFEAEKGLPILGIAPNSQMIVVYHP